MKTIPLILFISLISIFIIGGYYMYKGKTIFTVSYHDTISSQKETYNPGKIPYFYEFQKRYTNP